MQVIEDPCAGRFAIASRPFRCGEIVHAALPFVVLPTVNVLRDASRCVCCLGKIDSPAAATNENQETDNQQEQEDSSSSSSRLVRCPTCGAAYCSPACLHRSSRAHRLSGECAVLRAHLQLLSTSTPWDSQMLQVAAIIARAVAEGLALPTNDNTRMPVPPAPSREETAPNSNDDGNVNNNNNMASVASGAGGGAAAASSSQSPPPPDVFVQLPAREDEPRRCVATMFPDLAAAAAELLVKKNQRSDENESSEYQGRELIRKLTILPDFVSSSSSSSSLQEDDDQNELLIHDKHARLEEIRKICAAEQENNSEVDDFRLPAFSDFCQLVSHAHVSDKSEVDDVDLMLFKYRMLAKRAVRIFQEEFEENQQRENQNQNQQQKEEDQSRFFVPNVDATFVLYLYSGYASNCFGIYNSDVSSTSSSSSNSAASVIARGTYPVHAALFNHSCDPNLIRRNQFFSPKKHENENENSGGGGGGGGGRVTECFYAMRDIQPGEHLSIDYGGAGFVRSVAERRAKLKELYKFWCRCSRCELEQNQQEQEQQQEDGNRNDYAEDETTSTTVSASEVISTCKTQRFLCEHCPLRGELRTVTDENFRIVGRECRMCFNFVPC